MPLNLSQTGTHSQGRSLLRQEVMSQGFLFWASLGLALWQDYEVNEQIPSQAKMVLVFVTVGSLTSQPSG